MLDPNSDYRQQRNKTMIERYGDVVPTKSEIVKEKTRLTCEKRFGVPHPMMNDIVKTKMIESLKQNDLQAIAVRRLETMKRNNSFKKSRPEEKFYQLLIERFGEHDIERNKRPDGTAWPIDFYIKSIDIWLQVDGIYWHGLDGHLDQHRQNIDVNKRSKIIVYKWETDRKQERWFTEHNMKLMRFTDLEVLSMKECPCLLSVDSHSHLEDLHPRT